MSRLAQKRARYGEVVAAMEKLREKTIAADGNFVQLTDDELKEYDALIAEADTLEKDIDQEEDLQRRRAKSASPVGSETTRVGIGHNGGPKIEAQPKKLDTPEKVIAVIVQAVGIGKSTYVNPMKLIEDWGYGELAGEIETTAKTLTTLTGSAGGITVPERTANEMIEILRQDTTFLAGNPVRLDLPEGNLTIPGGASGATASYGTENTDIPVTEPSFREVTMAAKRLAAIVPMTNELLARGRNVENFVTQDLRAAMADMLDLKAYLGDGTSGTPVGIFNQVGIGTRAANATVNYANTILDRGRVTLGLRTAMKAQFRRPVWIMSARSAQYLADLQNGQGIFAFPDMNSENPRWGRYPVVVSDQIPENLGAGTNETFIALVDFGHILFGETAALVIDTSDEATIIVSGSPISAYQRNLTLIRAIQYHDVAVRHAGAVQMLTGVTWGAA